MPQATRSDDHCTYRCYLRGPDGIREFSPCGPGAPLKLFLEAWAVNEVSRSGDGSALNPGAEAQRLSALFPYSHPSRQVSPTCSKHTTSLCEVTSIVMTSKRTERSADGGRSHDCLNLPTLLPSHGLFGMITPIPRAGPHLHEGEQPPPSLQDQIHLAVAEAIVSLHKCPVRPTEIVDREPLGAAA